MKKTFFYISISALFIIPIFPLIVANGEYFLFDLFFPFITGKGFFFRFFVEIAFASWVILAFMDAKYRPRLNAMTITVTIFALVTLLADLLGVNPIRSIWSNFERMEGWITIVHLWAFLITATSIFGSGEEGRKWWHRWLNTSLVISVIVSVYGFLQLFGLADIHQGSSRIDASLGNAIYMAIYMLFHSFISAYFFFLEKQKGKSASKAKLWIYGIYSLIAVFLLFETATRGTIIGLVGGAMLALFLYAILGKNEPKRNRWISAGIIGAVVLVGVVFWLNRDSSFVRDNETLRRLAAISWNETKTQARAYTWPMALEGWTQRPILGWGQENFNYVFNANYNPKMWQHEQWFDRAHNIYLDWLINAGIVGFLAYLALYFMAFRLIWKSRLTLSQKSVLTGLVAGYAVHNIFVFDNLASYVFFFAILGFLSSLGSLKGDKDAKAVTVGGHKSIREEVVEYVVIPISTIAFLLIVFFFEIRPLQANLRLISALQSCVGPTPDVTLFAKALSTGAYVADQEIREHSLNCAYNVINNQQLAGPTKQAFFEMAMRNIEGQINATPKDARMYILGGNFLNNIGQYELAQSILEKANLLSPNKQSAALELFTSYMNGGRIEDALKLAKDAYESETGHTQMKLAYLMAMIASGKESEARQIFADDPAIFDNEQLSQVYISLGQYSKAADLYKRIIAANPQSLDARVNLAKVEYAAGMKTQAINTLKQAIKDFPEYESLIQGMIDSAK